MAKRKNMMDMTPVCERCGKVATVDEKLSTPNWTVYRTKEPCECGGKYTARAFLDDRVLSSCDKEANQPDEYISREAALKAANEWVNEACMAPVMRISRLFDKLAKVPAADVAKVVRCKDCKHAERYERTDGTEGYYCGHPRNTFTYGERWDRTFKPVKEVDDFCSYGEYRTNTGGVTE